MTSATSLAALRAQWQRRPWWMNALMLFCLYMAVIYVPWDLFVKPVAADEEVWFGVRLHGWAAKAATPLHWFIYGAGAWGFWHMRRWMWPWAALYCAQVALSMLIWPILYVSPMRGMGQALGTGVVAGAVFLVPTIALWRAKGRFAS